jgi:hypothetical protein
MRSSFAKILAPAALLLLAACSTDAPEGGSDAPIGPPTTVVTTGLEGHVIRGPMQPVCVSDLPCEEPFAATFHVKQQGAKVSEFSSGADGYFVVFLEPGEYEIVPAAEAPLPDPESQVRPVRVGATGLTRAEFSFDTGIR